MAQNSNQIIIRDATITDADDWTEVFLKGIGCCPWMKSYLQEREISATDVTLSFIEDIQIKDSKEIFLIAYNHKIPIGIIRLDEYWFPKQMKIVSHYPLIIPEYQKQGIGKQLVMKGIHKAKKEKCETIWAECWSKDYGEVVEYRTFYQKVGFKNKSNRYEMQLDISTYKPQQKNNPELTIEKTTKLTKKMIAIISTAYAQSEDRLHKIEQLGKTNIARKFLKKTLEIYKEAGYKVTIYIAKIEKQLAGVLLTASKGKQGSIMEIGVAPEFRGQQIATNLIQIFLKEAVHNNLTSITLGVDKTNSAALKLYKKFGFVKSWYGTILRFEKDRK
ncbi:MAG: GNAT family N-acetyltransferase [Asgard group archaeon]|nr:GNAT family N-acetyltransferase [Asgard group archaeon]